MKFRRVLTTHLLGLRKNGMRSEYVRENLEMYSLLLPVLILVFIFCYIPLYGLVISFQDYSPGAPFVGEGVKWVGLKHFVNFVSSKYFYRILRNTLVLNSLNLIFGFTAPIIFALLANEVKRPKIKKLVQTASYLPYFYFFGRCSRHGDLIYQHGWYRQSNCPNVGLCATVISYGLIQVSNNLYDYECLEKFWLRFYFVLFHLVIH